MHTSTSGGSRLTEQKALTVRPSVCPEASRVVTTVTPLGNRPSVRRKVEASTLMGSGPGGERALQLELRREEPEPQRDARGHERLEQHERHELAAVADHREPRVGEREHRD